ncbi:uncharacterized protein SAPINGB_P000379 [Magnusiomyces paraingens]|uniref:FAD/NAD(P)-binding domain-containing protein n=1 Tax=Magnusiomyces paraingens TaxID=2606893 RepID=A0A5E8AZA4_9ASCO|nr:uncharacterized protein SAPINGB_P000379 [Saprochaete ingens]VVT44327.1 unnamed protein product [Saprochaete ingens]
MTSTYDCLIIGGGPAGLATALALCRALRTCVIFDNGTYRNASTSHMHTVLTWDHHAPHEFRQAAHNELIHGRYKTVAEIVQGNVERVEKQDDYKFTVTSNGTTYHGKTIVFASGVEDSLSSIPGLSDGWGETVFHCLFCHGFEERGSPSAGLLLDNPMVLGHLVEIAGMASKLADKVTIYTNGQDFTTMPNPREGDLLALQTRLERHGFKFDSRPITKIVAHELSIDLVFDGSQTSHRFLSYFPKQTVRNKHLMQPLGVKFLPSGHVETLPMGQATHAPGVFVAGDNCTFLQQVSGAINMGTIAGANVHHHLIRAELP